MNAWPGPGERGPRNSQPGPGRASAREGCPTREVKCRHTEPWARRVRLCSARRGPWLVGQLARGGEAPSGPRAGLALRDERAPELCLETG